MSFGAGTVAAYIIALEAEITAVRMILTCKRYGMAQEKIRERLRDLYV